MAKSVVVREFDWFAKYKELAKDRSHHVVLESGRGGRYDIIGLDPWAVLEGKGEVLSIEHDDEKVLIMGPLLDSMKEWMSNYITVADDSLPDFQGGAIGFFSYDLIRQIEEIPNISEDDLDTYDLYFLLFNDVFVYDQIQERFWIITHYLDGQEEVAKKRLVELERIWFSPVNERIWDCKNVEKLDDWKTSFSEESFKGAVRKIQDYIANGDVFQVNLSVRQEKKLQTEPLHIYEKLRQINPSPYMCYFETPEIQLVSGSPELLVKKQGTDISTRPIAGTRSRGKSEEEDYQLAKALIENEKEKAEHVMLVDLERNDLGKVSQYGTVEVNELMVIEKYSHVMHIVSNVKGKLDPKYDVYDVIRAAFPGGTITGAPKIRTMEIIEELEPVRRGVYTGSIGWIGYNGNMELNITIRTLLARDGCAYVQAGAGIVIDSNPEAEYKESLKKAKALWRAKEMSEEEKRIVTLKS